MYILSIWCLWLLTFAESAEEDDILAALGQELESEERGTGLGANLPEAPAIHCPLARLDFMKIHPLFLFLSSCWQLDSR